MRVTRVGLFVMLLLAGLSIFQAFPSEPAQRAALVCRPVRFLADVASALSSSMNDSGRVGALRQPWHDNAYRTCERIAASVLVAADES